MGAAVESPPLPTAVVSADDHLRLGRGAYLARCGADRGTLKEGVTYEAKTPDNRPRGYRFAAKSVEAVEVRRLKRYGFSAADLAALKAAHGLAPGDVVDLVRVRVYR